MKPGLVPDWYAPDELPRITAAIVAVHYGPPMTRIANPDLRFVHIKINRYTGDFAVLDGSGFVIPEEQLEQLFPDLAEDKQVMEVRPLTLRFSGAA